MSGLHGVPCFSRSRLSKDRPAIARAIDLGRIAALEALRPHATRQVIGAGRSRCREGPALPLASTTSCGRFA